MMRKATLHFLILAGFMAAMLSPCPCGAASYKVLVVMSYHDDYPWQQEIRRGIINECGPDCDLKFFTLDMKNNPGNGPAKAREAYELYRSWRPDGVIASDDFAQSEFVVPYLKAKVKTPVVFCGVNEEPETYGYPASNVTGVLERYHFRETITLLKLLVPGVKSVGFIMRGNEPTTTGNIKQLQAAEHANPVRFTAFKEPATLEEAIEMAKELKGQSDAIYLEHFEGLPDRSGVPHTNREVIRILLGVIGNKPTICATEYTIKLGVLCAVVKSGAEQGASAVKLMLKALHGAPIARIPLTRNFLGVKYLNVNALKSLGINPPPALLRDVKLIKTSE